MRRGKLSKVGEAVGAVVVAVVFGLWIVAGFWIHSWACNYPTTHPNDRGWKESAAKQLCQ